MKMAMATKIVCLVLLCMVVIAPNAEALTCSDVANKVLPCLSYLKGGPLGGCCGGVKALLSLAKTPTDRQTACGCLKSAAKSLGGSINPGNAAEIPRLCHVNVGYPISANVDCSKVH